MPSAGIAPIRIMDLTWDNALRASVPRRSRGTLTRVGGRWGSWLSVALRAVSDPTENPRLPHGRGAAQPAAPDQADRNQRPCYQVY